MSLLDLIENDIEHKPAAAAPGHTGGRFEAILSGLRGGIAEGQRNTGLTQLAGLLRSHGLSADVIEGLLLSVNKSTGTNLAEREISSIARSVSRYSPKLEHRQPAQSDILTLDDCRARWEANRRNCGNCKSGFERLDRALFTFSPGEVLIMAGRSGTGKTNLGLSVSRGIARNMQSNALFCSLEMDSGSVFFRLANQKHSETTGTAQTAHDTVLALKGTDLAERVCMANNCILTVDRDSLTLEQIETYLVTAREKYTVDLLTVDYLGYIRDTGSGSNYDKVSRTAKGIKALAKRQQIRTILLCQTSRAGADGTEPVQLHHLRDSGAIEESGDYVVGLWYANDPAGRVHAEVLKNRHGAKGLRFDFVNSGLHLTEDEYRADPKTSKLAEF